MIANPEVALPWTPESPVFGAGRSERCVETPWAAHWIAGRRKVFDIGFSLSDLGWLRALLDSGAEVSAADIVRPERVASRYPDDLRERALAVPVALGDIRTLDLPEGGFDAVTCISTIEHIGFDAPGDGADSAFARWSSIEETPTQRPAGVSADVMAAIVRTLRPGGLALVTTPMGKGGAVPIRDSLGFYTRQWESDADGWTGITNTPGLRLLEQRFFTWLGAERGWTEAKGPGDLAHQTAWLTPHATGVALAALERV